MGSFPYILVSAIQDMVIIYSFGSIHQTNFEVRTIGNFSVWCEVKQKNVDMVCFFTLQLLLCLLSWSDFRTFVPNLQNMHWQILRTWSQIHLALLKKACIDRMPGCVMAYLLNLWVARDTSIFSCQSPRRNLLTQGNEEQWYSVI